MLIATLIAFIQSVNANLIDDVKNKLVAKDIFFFNDCVAKLIEQGILQYPAEKLCIDKYASTLGHKDWSLKEQVKTTEAGRITIRLANDSNSFVIKKIVFSGQTFCKSLNEDTNKKQLDLKKCPRKYYHDSKYVDINPRSWEKFKTNSQFKYPESWESDNWAWTFDINDVYGFTLDY